MEKSRKRLIYEQRIHHVQDYISTHLDEELNLEKLAEIAAFSPFYFHRIFKAIAGETLHNFIQRIRLEKSCALLSSDFDKRIIDIALACGFATPASFSKAFKQRYSITPSEWRNGKELDPPVEATGDRDLKNLYDRREKMNIEIEILPPYRIAYMRRIGPYGADNALVLEKLIKWAGTRELLSGSSITLGIAHDNPELTPPEKCRYDSCIVIPADYKVENNINTNDLPGGKYAVYRINGITENAEKAWNDFFSTWLPDSGYQCDDRPHFEKYVGNIESEIEQTGTYTFEICIPVKPL
ncbi:MAG: AraC family transcriptional regulator [bacterium]|nr:AraC family transcriptional regulator [bacterium]